MTILLSDPRVLAVPVHDRDEPLVRLPLALGPARALVRAGLADRLRAAAARLAGEGLGLRVLEGHRSPADQAWIVAAYAAELLEARPDLARDEAELVRLTSRFVSPVAVAPHVAGAAVDLTLVDLATGEELDLGCPVDATPEQSDGRCATGADVPSEARRLRDRLAAALEGAGLVNYPTEWWHWSHGDRYWALVTGAPAALHGPVDAPADAPDRFAVGAA